MQLGMRPRFQLPTEYKSYRVYQTHGRVVGVPHWISVEQGFGAELHPDIVSAGSLEELQTLIDGLEATNNQPEWVETCDDFDIVVYRGQAYGIPRGAGKINWAEQASRQRAGIISAATIDELRQTIIRQRGCTPVEFAGWMPVFKTFGNCGKHPQFNHTAQPPAGYRFTSTRPVEATTGRWKARFSRLSATISRLGMKCLRTVSPPFSLLFGGGRIAPAARVQTLRSAWSLFRQVRRNGVSLFAAIRFLQSRHLRSQLQLSRVRGLTFLTSMPFTFGQTDWMVEIEDPTTLFYPDVQNGFTCEVDVRRLPCWKSVRTLLESDSCKGILTHMRSTAKMVPRLFDSEKISEKIVYAPLGVPLPPRWQKHNADDTETIDLLFINSWCQIPSNFYLRGGLDVLEAFSILRERYPQLRLTLRTALPALDSHYHRILESGWVRVINRFLSAEEMADLHATSHIFLLPAARVHIVSLLQAMSYGLAVVASDGWGFEEYLTHERNALVVKGRYGKVSWADAEAGMLREDYSPLYRPDSQVIDGIVESVSRLIEDHEFRRRLGANARHDVEKTYNLSNWNQALKNALDKISGRSATSPNDLKPEKIRRIEHTPVA